MVYLRHLHEYDLLSLINVGNVNALFCFKMKHHDKLLIGLNKDFRINPAFFVVLCMLALSIIVFSMLALCIGVKTFLPEDFNPMWLIVAVEFLSMLLFAMYIRRSEKEEVLKTKLLIDACLSVFGLAAVVAISPSRLVLGLDLNTLFQGMPFYISVPALGILAYIFGGKVTISFWEVRESKKIQQQDVTLEKD